MARGKRKTQLEKLQIELTGVQEAIVQYESCLITLKEKEETVKEMIQKEEVNKLIKLLKEKGMEVQELTEMIKHEEVENEKYEEKQSA